MAAVITSLRNRVSKDGKHTAIVLSIKKDGEAQKYTLSEGTYREIGCPLSGDTVSEEELALLSERDRHQRARKSAFRILSYSDNSRSALIGKLVHAGFERALAERVCDEMQAHGYLNEDSQLERAVIKYANDALLGKYKIAARLAAKGYRSSAVFAKISELLERGEIDFSDSFCRLKEKKLPREHTHEDEVKLLYKYGYRKC